MTEPDRFRRELAGYEYHRSRLVGVFGEVRRVLSPTGTCWINIGDSCAGGGKHANTFPLRTSAAGGGVLPPKNLVGVPWRVAFALQTSGWWLRSAIIWAKPKPVPESVTDRLSTTYGPKTGAKDDLVEVGFGSEREPDARDFAGSRARRLAARRGRRRAEVVSANRGGRAATRRRSAERSGRLAGAHREPARLTSVREI